MTVEHAVDVRLKQTNLGAACDTGFTFKALDPAPITLTDLVELAAYLIAELVPLVNAVQAESVTNISVNLQARGTITPSYFEPVGGGGSAGVSASAIMPPEFAYWFRYGVGETLESISGDVDTVHPIKRGGAFITGCSDAYLEDGIFSIPSAWVAAWGDLGSIMQVPQIWGTRVWDGAVLGEEIASGTGWRIATVTGAVPLRITRLKSRLAIG